jgi:hypothetical protein
MTANMHFIYTCEHMLKIQDELVPSWLIKEFYSGVEFDPDTWQGLEHDYGTIQVNDVCDVCKEEASKKRRRAAGTSSKRSASKIASSTATSPSTASEKSSASGQQTPP